MEKQELDVVLSKATSNGIPKKQLTQKEEIIESIRNVQEAMIASLEAKEQSVIWQKKETKTHYNLIKANERLRSLQFNFN